LRLPFDRFTFSTLHPLGGTSTATRKHIMEGKNILRGEGANERLEGGENIQNIIK